MVNDLAAVQPLVLGGILLWSSYGKLVGDQVPAKARRTALVPLLGKDRAVPAFRAVGVAEVLVGLALVLSPVGFGAALGATALATGFVAYLVYAKVAAPDSSCGCVGSKAAPVSWRSLGRAGLMLLGAVLALTATSSWWTVFADRTAFALAVVVVEAMAFAALSAELDHLWLVPLRRYRLRLTHPLSNTAGDFEVPLVNTQQQLLRSPAYREVSPYLRSDIREHWDEGEWRFVSYTAAYDERAGLAVFAVPRTQYEPDDVLVAIVDDETGKTLYKPRLVKRADLLPMAQ
ncbi:MauE/DoxX family redox-associated membrane protein [Kribbella deserti]|uniref:MauE/DoxX family redox-associated membrane protein n=1 Tax=Kribbella deserti TaxID=1926257 RepID=A0ABV6QTA7_9ACTN